MKITEVSGTFSFTRNLGNYQSLKAEVTIVSQVEDGEEPEAVFKNIFDMAKKQVRKQAYSSEVK